MSDTPRIPLSHTLTSLLGFGPMPLTKIVACHHLVAEATRIRRERDPAKLSHAEDSLREQIEATADRQVEHAVGKVVEPRIAEIRGLHAEAGYLAHQIGALDERRYVGPHGESMDNTQAHLKHSAWCETIDQDFATGAVRHRRTDPGTKKRVARMLWLDVPILTFLMLKFLNVNFLTFWQTPGGWVKTGTALLFGVLGTVGVAMTMKVLGKRHRGYRTTDGSWDLRSGRGVLRTELALTGLIVLAVSGAMTWRFVLDGRGDDHVLTAVMAMLFAVVTGAVAYLAYTAEFADGSTLTEAVDALAPQLHRTHQEWEALCAKRAIVMAQVSRLTAALHRSAVEIRTAALRTVRESAHERAIRYARSIHQQNGCSSELPAPRVDCSALNKALDQVVPDDDANPDLDRAELTADQPAIGSTPADPSAAAVVS